MEEPNSHRDMLRDLVLYFREVGSEADASSLSTDEAAHFHEGRAAAYREVLNSIKNHAISFTLSLEEIGLQGFDPLSDPLGLPKELDRRP